jgi:hypothetical protein
VPNGTSRMSFDVDRTKSAYTREQERLDVDGIAF